MSTYDNVLGNFISHADDLSDLDDDPYEDSGSEPEPEMGIRNSTSTASKINTPDERTQLVESLLSKLSKHSCTQIYKYIVKVFFSCFLVKVNLHVVIMSFNLPQ